MTEENIVKKTTIKLIVGAVNCPIHGPQIGAKYRAQDPAPCGCAWVREGRKLVVCLRQTSRKEEEKG